MIQTHETKETIKCCTWFKSKFGKTKNSYPNGIARFENVSINGFPDLKVWLDGKSFYVEYKKIGGTVATAQHEFIGFSRYHGDSPVFICFGVEQFKELVLYIDSKDDLEGVKHKWKS